MEAQMKAQIVTCNCVGVYTHALTRGKHYDVVGHDEGRYRIVGDHGRRVWISQSYFELGLVPILIMIDWKFDDDVTAVNIVEVTITFNDGSQRWCNMSTPEGLVEHFKNPMMEPPGMHSRHLIIMKTLDYNDVEKMLKDLDSQGEPEEITIPLI
ncbi:hypothetical protein D3C87_1165590 [compost metagenome]